MTERPAEDSWAVRWIFGGAAVGLAFGSGVAVLISHAIDRLKGRP